MGVSGSVVATVSAAGAQSVTFPQVGLSVVGISSIGIYYISVPIDATRNGVIPFASYSGTEPRYTKVTWKVQGNIINFTPGAGASAGTIVFYYGTPSSDTPNLTSFSGVSLDYTTSATANTVTSETLTLPSGNLTLVGFAVIYRSSTETTSVNWSTSSGLEITLYGFVTMVGGNELIYPLTGIGVGTTLTLNVASPLASALVSVIAYYA